MLRPHSANAVEATATNGGYARGESVVRKRDIRETAAGRRPCAESGRARKRGRRFFHRAKSAISSLPSGRRSREREVEAVRIELPVGFLPIDRTHLSVFRRARRACFTAQAIKSLPGWRRCDDTEPQIGLMYDRPAERPPSGYVGLPGERLGAAGTPRARAGGRGRALLRVPLESQSAWLAKLRERHRSLLCFDRTVTASIVRARYCSRMNFATDGTLAAVRMKRR